MRFSSSSRASMSAWGWSMHACGRSELRSTRRVVIWVSLSVQYNETWWNPSEGAGMQNLAFVCHLCSSLPHKGNPLQCNYCFGPILACSFTRLRTHSPIHLPVASSATYVQCWHHPALHKATAPTVVIVEDVRIKREKQPQSKCKCKYSRLRYIETEKGNVFIGQFIGPCFYKLHQWLLQLTDRSWPQPLKSHILSLSFLAHDHITSRRVALNVQTKREEANIAHFKLSDPLIICVSHADQWGN